MLFSSVLCTRACFIFGVIHKQSEQELVQVVKNSQVCEKSLVKNALWIVKNRLKLKSNDEILSTWFKNDLFYNF